MSPETPTNTIDDPELEKRFAGKQADKAEEQAIGLTIAERLTRRAKAQTVELVMRDEDGDFTIAMRQPTRAEMEDMQKMQELIMQESTQDKANDQLCGTLSDLCIDDSLNYEFWRDGNYSMNDLMDIVNKLFESIVVRVKEARSFRNT